MSECARTARLKFPMVRVMNRYGVTCFALGVETGMERARISDIRNGRINPTLLTMRRIVKGIELLGKCKLTLDDVFGEP